MKKLLFSRTARYATIFLLLLAFSATFTSCVVRPPHHSERRKLPPGHEKKLRGDRSAKRYAPGQQKKQHHKEHKQRKKETNAVGNYRFFCKHFQQQTASLAKTQIIFYLYKK